jgi:putative intracellular protease/amidase
MTAFTNSEESAVGLTGVVPFSLEDKLKEKKADFSGGEDWAPRVCVHGKLITGQNPASSEQCAQEVMRMLSGAPML